MKTGYPQAAWRLFETSFVGRRPRPGALSWAHTELAGTPFQPASVSLPIVRPKSVQ